MNDNKKKYRKGNARIAELNGLFKHYEEDNPCPLCLRDKTQASKEVLDKEMTKLLKDKEVLEKVIHEENAQMGGKMSIQEYIKSKGGKEIPPYFINNRFPKGMRRFASEWDEIIENELSKKVGE